MGALIAELVLLFSLSPAMAGEVALVPALDCSGPGCARLPERRAVREAFARALRARDLALLDAGGVEEERRLLACGADVACACRVAGELGSDLVLLAARVDGEGSSLAIRWISPGRCAERRERSAELAPGEPLLPAVERLTAALLESVAPLASPGEVRAAAPPAADEVPWLWIGLGVLALAGAAVGAGLALSRGDVACVRGPGCPEGAE